MPSGKMVTTRGTIRDILTSMVLGDLTIRILTIEVCQVDTMVQILTVEALLKIRMAMVTMMIEIVPMTVMETIVIILTDMGKIRVVMEDKREVL